MKYQYRTAGMAGAVVAAALLLTACSSGSTGNTATATNAPTAAPTPTVTADAPSTPTPNVTRPVTTTPIKDTDHKPVKPGSAAWAKMCNSNRVTVTPPVNGGPLKSVVSSTFYIGEEAGPSNANIDNIATAWNDPAVPAFGGVDRWGPKNPDNWEGPWYQRKGYCPVVSALRQNPFYVALPTPDFDENGALAAAQAAARVGEAYLPELRTRLDNGQEWLFKNLWVEVRYGTLVAYGQLEDIGPSSDTGAIVGDYHYVWGTGTKPKNEFGLQAGIDLSPALSDYLRTKGEATVQWRWVSYQDVPDGPWKTLVTMSAPSWR